MQLVRSITASAPKSRASRVLTIGAFDGVHLGHQEIFRRALDIGAERRQPLAAFCFEPTPSEFFARGEPPARLTCFRERFEQLEAIGIDELICPPFQSVSSLEHSGFVRDVLVGQLGVSHIVVGHDFRYGAGRTGTVETLSEAGAARGFGVTVVDPVYAAGERISSTRIREALGRGDLDSAASMLGRDYSMSGRVVHGLGLGRDLGFPTANVNLKRRRAPVDGIFAVRVDGLREPSLAGVASVGSRPTVGGGKTLLEVYLFDFDTSIYGAYITVRFQKRLRSEHHFGSIAALQEQIRADVVAAKAALGG